MIGTHANNLCDMAATGTAHESDPLRVDSEFTGLLTHPPNSVSDIEHSSGVAGHSAVAKIDRHDNEPGGGDCVAVTLAEGPVHPSPRATMNVNDCSTATKRPCFRWRLVNPRQ